MGVIDQVLWTQCCKPNETAPKTETNTPAVDLFQMLPDRNAQETTP